MGAPRIDRLDKNYIINGNFDFWQRNYNFIGGGAVYTADRMFCTYGSGSAQYFRSTDVPDSLSTYSLQVTNTTGTVPQLNHRIESVFAKDLASKTVTVKFKVKATDSTGTPIKLMLSTPTTVDNFASAHVYENIITAVASPAAGTWYTYSVTVALPASTAKGMEVKIYRDSNGTPVTTTTFFSQLQVILGENDSTNYIYAGRNQVEELQLCQRYFEKSSDVGTPADAGIAGGSVTITAASSSVGGIRHSIVFKVVKRAVPVFKIYNPFNGAVDSMRNLSSPSDVGATSDRVGTQIASVSNTLASSATHVHSFHWTADAEL